MADTSFEDTTLILQYENPIAPKVMVVDDDSLVLEYMKGLIMNAGFQVRTAPNGDAALKALEAEFVPIVITDRNMPGMDGLELCRRIRGNTYPGYVYVLLLTVKDTEEDILGGLEAGADDYISKRASSAQLIARLRTGQRILTLEHSLKAALEEKRRIAMTDPLTDMHNRRYFMRNLGRELDRHRRMGGNLAVLMLDIDHFKQINDRHGHAVGDEVLREFSERISAGLPRSYEWCARLGGEEFAVVLPQTDAAGALVVAERLRSAVCTTRMRTTAGLIQVTTSVGVATLGDSERESSVDLLLDLADRQLYESKKNGRNRVSGATGTAG